MLWKAQTLSEFFITKAQNLGIRWYLVVSVSAHQRGGLIPDSEWPSSPYI
jgi:hypothetical protein